MTKTFELLGDSPEKAAAGSRQRHDHRDRAGQGLARPRRHARSRHPLPPHVGRRPPGQDPELRLEDLPRRHRPARTPRPIVVTSLPYLDTANAEITDENLPAIKSYLRWHAVHDAAPLLSKNFEELNFDFFNRTLNGQKEEQPRWQRCTAAHRPRARRGRRPGLGQAELPARVQRRPPSVS